MMHTETLNIIISTTALMIYRILLPNLIPYLYLLSGKAARNSRQFSEAVGAAANESCEEAGFFFFAFADITSNEVR